MSVEEGLCIAFFPQRNGTRFAGAAIGKLASSPVEGGVKKGLGEDRFRGPNHLGHTRRSAEMGKADSFPKPETT